MEKLNSELKNLQEVNKNFEKLQKELHAATKTLQGRADKSEATLKTLEASLKAAEVSAASTQKALQAVSWQCTTGSVTHTKIILWIIPAGIGAEHGQLCFAIVQAELQAENASARLEELLHRTTTAWLPLWLEEHYQKVRCL